MMNLRIRHFLYRSQRLLVYVLITEEGPPYFDYWMNILDLAYHGGKFKTTVRD
jgi:hypothetical protein